MLFFFTSNARIGVLCVLILYTGMSTLFVHYFYEAEESWKLESSAKAGGNEEAEVSLAF